MTSNVNVTREMSPALFPIVGKIRSIFDKLVPSKKKSIRQFETTKSFQIGDKVFVKGFKAGKEN